jgi:hypothetical protein
MPDRQMTALLARLENLERKVSRIERVEYTPYGEVAGKIAYYRAGDASLNPPGDVDAVGDVGAGGDIMATGGLAAGGTTLNPDTGDVLYTGTLVSRKSSTNYDCYAYVPATSMISIYSSTSKTSSGTETITVSGIPDEAVAVQVGIATSGTVGAFYSASATSGDFHHILARALNTSYKNHIIGIIKLGVGTRQFHGRWNTAGTLSVDLYVLGYFI